MATDRDLIEEVWECKGTEREANLALRFQSCLDALDELNIELNDKDREIDLLNARIDECHGCAE